VSHCHPLSIARNKYVAGSERLRDPRYAVMLPRQTGGAIAVRSTKLIACPLTDVNGSPRTGFVRSRQERRESGKTPQEPPIFCQINAAEPGRSGHACRRLLALHQQTPDHAEKQQHRHDVEQTAPLPPGPPAQHIAQHPQQQRDV
jgi:hypothetical protein